MQYTVVGSLLVIIIVVAGWLIAFYNKMSNKKALADDSWRTLNVLFHKRSDLIKAYSENGSEYVNPEAEPLKGILIARSSYLNAESPGDVIKASLEISIKFQELRRGYERLERDISPGLAEILTELDELELRIEKYREIYNHNVQNYNIFLSAFPNSLAGRIVGAEELSYFYK